MKLLFLVIATVLSVHEIIAQECTPETCAKLKCAQPTTCPPGTYKKSGGTCNCCSVCAKYQIEGQSCDNQECLPGLKCNANKTCESTYKPKFCSRVRCAAAKNCPEGQVLMPSDTNKCRCCDACVDKNVNNTTETRKCVDGNYVNSN